MYVQQCLWDQRSRELGGLSDEGGYACVFGVLNGKNSLENAVLGEFNLVMVQVPSGNTVSNSRFEDLTLRLWERASSRSRSSTRQ